VRGGVELSVAADPADDPKPQAKTRLVKQLAPGTEDVDVYELFRPFGPLARAVRILTNPAGVHTGFRGMALLEFYAEEDAARAQNEMHCTEVRGKTISVAIDSAPRRPSAAGGQEFSAAAAPFVPGAGASRGMSAAAPSFTPPQRNVSGSSSSIYATQPAPPQLNSQQAGPIIAVPGTNLQYSASAATYIDPCNLFCKNLDPEISSNDLFAAFKQFGRIVSARVMRDEHGVSREFGFVSYTTADEASRALHAMNNVVLGSKAMMVRLHEPKKMREQKLAHKFSGAPTNGVGPHGRGSPPVSGHASETNGSPAGTPNLEQGGFAAARKLPERPAHTFTRGASDNAAASGSTGSEPAPAPLSMQSITAELAQKVGALPTVRAEQVDDIVKEMLKLSLPETLEALNNPVELMQRVNDARDELPQSPVAQQSAFLSTPLQPVGTLADSASVMSSAPASAKERERLLKAVHAIVPAGSPVEDITDMLTSLNKKDRALCLFNADFLRTKVDEAREILDITEEDGEEVKAKSAGSSPVVTSQSPAAAIAAAASGSTEAAAEPAAPTHTLVSLARLPAIEIIRLASAAPDSGSAGLPLPKADPEKMRETDEFIDSLKGKPAHDQKQKVRQGDASLTCPD
jgi:polyadenylate-binding protein